MRNSHKSSSRQVSTRLRSSSSLKVLLCGLALSATLGIGATANATDYDEGAQGDLSNTGATPTSIGALTFGDNHVIGSTIPSGSPIPGGHGALTNQDDDFFTFTVPNGGVLSQFDLESDTSIVSGDRFFLGIYPGNTTSVDPSNPTPMGLLGYTLPGVPQIGKDVLPDLAASNEPGFPPLPTHFSGSLGAGEYTVWLVDGDAPVNYDLNLVVAPAPEPAMWMLMIVGMGLTGAMLRRLGSRAIKAAVS